MSRRQTGVTRLKDDFFSLSRRLFGSAHLSVSRTDTVFARARLEVARISEHYRYEQEISRNSSIQRSADPTGQIELVVPYDGDRCFTRQAREDIRTQVGPVRWPSEALVGHLSLAGHRGTDLGDVLGLHGGYGTVPILVPVDGDEFADGPDGLVGDRRTCTITYDYSPSEDNLRIVPIKVLVEMHDPDSVDMPMSIKHIDQVPDLIRQQVSFGSDLLLIMRVLAHVEKCDDAPFDKLEPVVSRVSLDWPTITSLGSLHLFVGERDVPFRYNPLTRSIEWWDVPMRLDKPAGSDDGDIKTYMSEPMHLLIKQPGELYQQISLSGEVEVEVPGRLLSGLQARLYDGLGALDPDLQPELVSRVTDKFQLILDDAFARRPMSPYQHLFFDEVIPHEMRIADIVSALKDRGFEIKDVQQTKTPDNRVLFASRSEGPEVMHMWIFVEGRRYTTERKRQSGGQTYTSEFETGDLRIYLCGQLAQDSRELTHEMNALQQALRERFSHTRIIR